jgi:small nuclear ribonucleoprotein (snRNP)-like protein
MIQPKELLPKCINQQVKVITQYSTYYTGTLIAYDEFMNLILAGDVKERKLSSKEEIISSIGGDDKRVMICGFSVSIIVPGV